jgi:putative ABC transport system permease protein
VFKNYVIIALRNIRKHKSYSFISVFGLAVGISCCLLILLYIIHEFGYDRYNKNINRIFRLIEICEQRGRTTEAAMVRVLPSFREEFPEVKEIARIYTYSWKEKALVSNGKQDYFEERFFLSDSSLFRVFSFSFVRGTPETALVDSKSLVITESVSRKYFGDEDPMGKTLFVKNIGPTDFRITGVIKDMPEQSHFHCDFIADMASGCDLFWKNFLENNQSYTYILLTKGSSPSELEAKFPKYLQTYFGDKAAGLALKLQPLSEIHLHSHLGDEIEANGDIRYVYLLSLLAIIILLIACANYVNLAIARSLSRSREVGLRKVLGANRIVLLKQFLSESVLVAFIAVPVAVLLAELLLPAFNSILGKSLSFGQPGGMDFILGTAAVTILAGLISGVYPAFVLSSYEPAAVLKTKSISTKGASLVRKILVVAQYSVSVVLIICTLVVDGQMLFIQRMSLGFNKDQVLIVPLKDYESQQAYGALKAAWLQIAGVKSVTASGALPSSIRFRQSAWFEGISNDSEMEVIWDDVDFDFLETYGIDLTAGRSFSHAFATDDRYAYIINETAAKALGWTPSSAPGKKMTLSNRGLKRPSFEVGDIIGVVKDFHFMSLHNKILPLVLKINKEDLRYVGVRIRSGQIQNTLAFMKEEWRNILPGRPFDFSFFDTIVNGMYLAEKRTAQIFGYSTLLSLILACLGLFGLASFSAAQRSREIAIRKVLGASPSNLVGLLSSEFALMVLAGNLLGLPVAYIIARKWLNGFAYHIRLGPAFFVTTICLSFIIAFFSVSSQAVKVALADPVDVLRYE